MGKITGREVKEQLPEKVILIYRAVLQLLEEGVDLANLKVSDITEKAGIGKGTAYDYFDSKEDILVYALLFFIEDITERAVTGIWEQDGLVKRLFYLFNSADLKTGEGVCMLRFVNLILEPSKTGQLLREKVREREQCGQCMPFLIGRQIVEQGIASGELREDLPVGYMMYVLVTKFIAYHVYALHERFPEEIFFHLAPQRELSTEEFRELTVKGILQEFGKPGEGGTK